MTLKFGTILLYFVFGGIIVVFTPVNFSLKVQIPLELMNFLNHILMMVLHKFAENSVIREFIETF